MNYADLISIENVFQAWNEFRKGKTKKPDVQLFERHLEDNLFALHYELQTKTYRHGRYQSFFVNDPKRRHIHKARVADRVLHHLLYKYLYELFDKTFIYDSYSCRLEKGTHKGVQRLVSFTWKVSKNYTRNCFALKCDIQKFFASVDHEILLQLLSKKIADPDILWLLTQVIDSFHVGKDKGIPLGNLTSQVFANIYMNELDQFVKHKLKVKYYLRYADDFLILTTKQESLYHYTSTLKSFLEDYLKLALHPQKISVRKLAWGIDFLGYIILPHGVVLSRTKTKRRILKRLAKKIEERKNGEISDWSFNQTLQSYLGYLSHTNTYILTQEIKNKVLTSVPL